MTIMQKANRQKAAGTEEEKKLLEAMGYRETGPPRPPKAERPPKPPKGKEGDGPAI